MPLLQPLDSAFDRSEAARFANAAASFAVEGYGSAAIPARAQVEHRLRTGQTYD